MTSSSMLRLADRPMLRGMFHLGAFLCVLPAGIVLLVAVDGPARVTSVAVYVSTLIVAFGISAAYHRIDWSPRMRLIMQRLDHASIYLMIAGTYVPLCLVALPAGWGIPLLSVVGAGALFGVVAKIAEVRSLRWFGYALYPLLGWAAVAAAPALLDHLSGWQLALIVVGGLSYSIGFPVMLVKRPDPWPSVFGYHEIWHAFTVLAALAHFVAVGSMTLS
jgi:hemolysin III